MAERKKKGGGIKRETFEDIGGENQPKKGKKREIRNANDDKKESTMNFSLYLNGGVNKGVGVRSGVGGGKVKRRKGAAYKFVHGKAKKKRKLKGQPKKQERDQTMTREIRNGGKGGRRGLVVVSSLRAQT